jgi:hypothetical protein
MEHTMSRTFQILSRTESAATVVGASLLSVITVGAVLALFASVTPDVSTTQPIVLERVTITAAKSA